MGAKEQLEENLRQLEETVAEAALYFRAQPDKPAAVGGPWGPREVLAHLLYWHEQTRLNAETLRAGRSVAAFTRSSEEVNAEAVVSHGGETMAAMVDELRRLQARLGEAFRALPDPEATVIIRANGARIGAAERPQVMSQHIRNHLAELSQS